MLNVSIKFLYIYFPIFSFFHFKWIRKGGRRLEIRCNGARSFIPLAIRISMYLWNSVNYIRSAQFIWLYATNWYINFKNCEKETRTIKNGHRGGCIATRRVRKQLVANSARLVADPVRQCRTKLNFSNCELSSNLYFIHPQLFLGVYITDSFKNKSEKRKLQSNEVSTQ